MGECVEIILVLHCQKKEQYKGLDSFMLFRKTDNLASRIIIRAIKIVSLSIKQLDSGRSRTAR